MERGCQADVQALGKGQGKEWSGSLRRERYHKRLRMHVAALACTWQFAARQWNSMIACVFAFAGSVLFLLQSAHYASRARQLGAAPLSLASLQLPKFGAEVTDQNESTA